MKAQEEVIEKLKGKKKFIVLSYDKGEIYIYDLYAKDEEEAHEIIEEEATNFSSDWLLSVEEFKSLKSKINKFKI